jgi:hypothetical protein
MGESAEYGGFPILRSSEPNPSPQKGISLHFEYLNVRALAFKGARGMVRPKRNKEY